MNIDESYELVCWDAIEQTEQVALLVSSKQLRDLVTIGFNLLKWETQRESDSDEESAERTVISAMFGRILDQLDACSTLLKVGSVKACGIMFRSIFELAFELDYLLIDPDTLRLKVVSYLIMGYEAELKNLLAFLNDEKYRNMRLEIEDRIDIVKKVIDSSRYENIKPAYESAVYKDIQSGERRKITPKWYTLATWQTAPKLESAKQLVEYMNDRGRVEGYGSFALLSNFTHSSMLIQESVQITEGKAAYLRVLRNPEGHKDIAFGACMLVSPTFQRMASRCLPEQQIDYVKASQEFNERYSPAQSAG